MAEMISLAVLRPGRERCGVADYAGILAASFPPDVRVLSVDLPETVPPSIPPAAAAAAQAADVVHVHYETSLFGSVKPYRDRFARLLRAIEKPRLVTLHGPVPPLVARWGNRTPYRAADLLRDVSYLPFFRRWESRHYELGEHWIVHTAELETAVARCIGESRVTRLPHPVPPARLRWRLEDSQAGALVTLGFVKPHKGYADLLPAVAERPGWRWVLAGAPQDERDEAHARELLAEMRHRGLAERVTLTGYLDREELERRAVRARLAVFPFRQATGSGSIAWAIALAMPVAATDLPSVRSLVAAGAGIALLPADRPAEWGEALHRLLGDADALRMLARRNAEFAARETFAACAARLGGIARRLAAQARSKPS
jgi:glycosyltransferase involved in cell wall biosynthesis